MLNKVLALFLSAFFVVAITENKDDVNLRDAGASKDRPTLEKYDMTEE